MRIIALLLAPIAVMAAACSDNPGPDSPTATATATQTIKGTATSLPALGSSGGASATPPAGIAEELLTALAARLSVAVASVSLLSMTPATWPDSCLGLGKPGTVCAQALVSGWLAILLGPGGIEYRYRIGGGQVAAEP